MGGVCVLVRRRLRHHHGAPFRPAHAGVVQQVHSLHVRLLGFGGVPFIAGCSLVRDADVMVWIELGGLTYVIGIVFFLLDRRYPAMHVVWHILVGMGALFHFVAVWSLTMEVMSSPKWTCRESTLWNYGIFQSLFPTVEELHATSRKTAVAGPRL